VVGWRVVATTTFVTSTSVTFEENKALPTSHAKKDSPDDGEVMGKWRIDRNLSRRTTREVVARGSDWVAAANSFLHLRGSYRVLS